MFSSTETSRLWKAMQLGTQAAETFGAALNRKCYQHISSGDHNSAVQTSVMPPGESGIQRSAASFCRQREQVS